MKCCIIGCKSMQTSYDKPYSLYRLVRKGKPREDWLKIIKYLNGQDIDPNTIGVNTMICIKHFERKHLLFICTKIILKSDASPSLFPKMIEKGISIQQTTKQIDFSSIIVPREAPYSGSPFYPSDSDPLAINKVVTREQQIAENKHILICDKLKKQNDLLKKSLAKKTNTLKALKRKLLRKEERIKTLTALVNELNNKLYEEQFIYLPERKKKTNC